MSVNRCQSFEDQCSLNDFKSEWTSSDLEFRIWRWTDAHREQSGTFKLSEHHDGSWLWHSPHRLLNWFKYFLNLDCGGVAEGVVNWNCVFLDRGLSLMGGAVAVVKGGGDVFSFKIYIYIFIY